MKINDKPFNPGELRTPVLLAPRTVITGTGGYQKPVPDTAHQVSALAKWIGAHGSEVWAADAAGVTEPATVTIRHRIIDPTWYISKDGGTRWYEIVSIDNIREYGELLELKVKLLRSG